jgi:predicted DCC family thiol-disulfide oxidoreductase YuxK
MTAPLPPRLVLYDGACGLCQRGVRLLLRLDRRQRLHFAPLQGETAARVFATLPPLPANLDSVVYVTDAGTPQAAWRTEGEAVLALAREVGGVAHLARGLAVLPRSWRDGLYRALARRRHRWFPYRPDCPLPTPTQRARFLP